MKITVTHDKNTDVAFLDVAETPQNVRILVIDVSDDLGLKSQVRARVDDKGNLYGLMVEDYTAFRREIRVKYVALKVDKIIDLIVATVKGVVAGGAPPRQPALC